MNKINVRDLRNRDILSQYISQIKNLLAGHPVRFSSDIRPADEVRLLHPPEQPPPIMAGVFGKKSISAVRPHADGLLLSVLSGRKYIEGVRSEFEHADSPSRELAAYVIFEISKSREEARAAARDALAQYLSVIGPSPLTEPYDINPSLRSLLSSHDGLIPSNAIDDTWVEYLSVAGNPIECADGLLNLFESGLDSIVLAPSWDASTLDRLDMTARDVIPALRSI